MNHVRQQWLVSLALLLFILSVLNCWAAPQVINYQGMLTDNGGDPVTAASLNIEFSIYTVLSGGSALWTEQQSVSVEEGVFNVQLGTVIPFPADMFSNDCFLGITVDNGTEMTPRHALASVPYALTAEDAITLDGFPADAFTLTGHAHDDRYNTKSEITTFLDGKSNTGHAHNDLYNTKSEITTFLDGKSNTVHSHSGNDISGGTVADGYIAATIARDSEIIPTVLAGDGSGSGLNADLLDNQNSSAFMPAGTDNWINETGGDSMTGGLEVSNLVIGTAWGEAIKGTFSSSTLGAGVVGESSGTDARGVHGGATGINGVGLYGKSTGDNGIGVYGVGPLWAGYFDGNVYINGEIHSTNGTSIVNASGNTVFHTGWRSDFGVYSAIYSGYDWGSGEPVSVVAGATGVYFTKGNETGTPHAETLASINTNGQFTCNVLEIKGGSDLAEPFKTNSSAAVEAGMLMTIDPDNPGQLKIADQAYDTRVAGIVSGADGINPGMIMTQVNSTVAGSTPVALSGRVYCLADAGYGAIKPGDMLTTSDTLGHAMIASDRERSYGTVIGKAMTPLEEGTGMVLVLVSLQ